MNHHKYYTNIFQPFLSVRRSKMSIYCTLNCFHLYINKQTRHRCQTPVAALQCEGESQWRSKGTTCLSDPKCLIKAHFTTRPKEFALWLWVHEHVTLLCYNTEHETLLCYNTEHGTLLCYNTEHGTLLCYNTEHGTLLCYNTEHGTLLCYNTECCVSARSIFRYWR